MTLVAGIDSSTQSCTVVVRDADDGSLVRRGQASHPPGTEVDPHAWERALEEAAAAAGGLDDVHGRGRGRPAARLRLARRERRRRTPRAALERQPVRAPGGRPDRRARRAASLGRRGRVRPGRVVHRDQGPLGGRARARQRRAHGGRVPAARLAGLAAARRAGARRPHHRSRRRERDGLVRRPDQHLPRRPRRARPRPPRRAAAGARPERVVGRSAAARAGRPGRRRHRRQHGRGPGAAGRGGRRRPEHRHLRAWPAGSRPTRAPTRPARSPGSRTPPAASCRWSPRSTPRGCSTPAPGCSASTTRRSPTSR